MVSSTGGRKEGTQTEAKPRWFPILTTDACSLNYPFPFTLRGNKQITATKVVNSACEVGYISGTPNVNLKKQKQKNPSRRERRWV